MPYSGTDVLAQLSEVIRQGASVPPLTNLLIISSQMADGEVLKSALRAIVGYEARIFVEPSVSVTVRSVPSSLPQIAFVIDESTHGFPALLAELRSAGFTCPVAIISDGVTAQTRSRLLENGAIDAFHRDDVCGLRLRQCFLRLAGPGQTGGSI